MLTIAAFVKRPGFGLTPENIREILISDYQWLNSKTGAAIYKNALTQLLCKRLIRKNDSKA
jgi:hypothetical protein